MFFKIINLRFDVKDVSAFDIQTSQSDYTKSRVNLALKNGTFMHSDYIPNQILAHKLEKLDNAVEFLTGKMRGDVNE